MGATEMTSRQRVEAALSHKEPDRTPMFEYVLLSPVADLILGRRYVNYIGERANWHELVEEIGWEAALKQHVTDRLDISEQLGHDMMYIPPNPLPPIDAPIPAPQPEPPDDPVERVRLRTRATEQSFTGPPEECFLVYAWIKEEMQQRGMDLPILAPAYAHGVWNDVDLMQTMALEPEVAHRHFALATKQALASVEAYIKLGIDQIGVGGDFAGNRPLISPKAYRDFIVPEVRKVSRRIHEAGKWAVNASDGDLWSVIDDFLLGCEVDGYLEIDMGAGMDIRRLKQEFGGRATFYGNMDCGNVMSFASVDEVARQTRECLEAGLGNGGHIFCCSNAITASVPISNYVAMVNAYRNMFGLGQYSL